MLSMSRVDRRLLFIFKSSLTSFAAEGLFVSTISESLSQMMMIKKSILQKSRRSIGKQKWVLKCESELKTSCVSHLTLVSTRVIVKVTLSDWLLEWNIFSNSPCRHSYKQLQISIWVRRAHSVSWEGLYFDLEDSFLWSFLFACTFHIYSVNSRIYRFGKLVIHFKSPYQHGHSIFHFVKKGIRNKILVDSMDYKRTDYFPMMSISGKKIDGWIVKDEIKRNEVLSVYRSAGIWMVLIP